MLEVGNGKMNVRRVPHPHEPVGHARRAAACRQRPLPDVSRKPNPSSLNKDVIAIDQDPLGKQGDRVSAEGPFEVWSKPLKDGSVAVGLFNRGHDAESMSLPLQKLGLSAGSKIHNVWNPTDSGHGPWMIPEHGVVLLIVKK